MNDKIIGLVMIFGSLSLLGFLFYWTILMPILDINRLYDAYLGLAIVFFVIAFIVLVFLIWIGWIFLKTRAPKEGMLEAKIEQIKNSEKKKEKVIE
jgi:membrane protein implicated in regulation of membrane protease activity